MNAEEESTFCGFSGEELWAGNDAAFKSIVLPIAHLPLSFAEPN